VPRRTLYHREFIIDCKGLVTMGEGVAATAGDSLGVGLIGSGFMGKCHALAWNAVAPTFGDVPRPRLRALADVSAELAAARAVELGFARGTGDWRSLLADPAIDVVSVTAPNAFHAEMTIAALQAGKHVWCEKPMAPTLAEAEAMAEAARRSGRVAIVGYNYVQNPAVRLMRKLVGEGAIGRLTHLRVEMDEDFMADPALPHSWRSEAAAGYGALDDFAVHPLSMLQGLAGDPENVFCEMARPYADRPAVGGGRRAVETHDIVTLLLRYAGGLTGTVAASRAAHGRKGRIFVQLFGDKGALAYDQERLNEVQFFTADGPADSRGFRTILMGAEHPPYGKFVPAPGHSLGFNDLKAIEARALIGCIRGEASFAIGFAEGLRIERVVHAAAKSFAEGAWMPV
jgi:predicted dehydrogenase